MVPFDEIGKYPRGSVSLSGATAERVGLIAWSDLDDLIAELLPSTVVAGVSIFPGVGAPFPGRPYLRAESLEWESYCDRITGPDAIPDYNTIPTYEFCKVSIKYGTPKGPQSSSEADEEDSDTRDPVQLLTHRWSIGGEYLTIPGNGLIWDDDSSKVSEDVTGATFIPTIEHQITWPRVTKPPFAAMRELIGKCNSVAFDFSTGTIAPETGLFLGAELEREVMSDGARAWSVSYRISEKRRPAADQVEPGGWNHFYRNQRTKTGWYRMVPETPVLPEDIYGIYHRGPFANLFVSG